MPNSVSPVIGIVMVGLLLAFITVSHISRSLADKVHQQTHKAEADHAPEGWQIAIEKPDGTVTYLKERKVVYSHKRYLEEMRK